MFNILIIGKTGYVSKCFQSYIKQFSDIEITAISVRNVEWKKMNFSRYHAVFNAIGLAHDNARKGTDKQFRYLNVELPVQIAEKAKKDGVKTFIHMSSMIVYGENANVENQSLINEKTEPNPAGIYGMSKLEGEKALLTLNDKSFNVAIIRAPLVYNENATDNFKRLKDFALTYSIFPKIDNMRSMLYADNLCELVRLIVVENGSGYYYPQDEDYYCTSKLVKDIANTAGKKMHLTKIFNLPIYIFSKRILLIRKVFGSLAYDNTISEAFEGRYRIVCYEEAINRIVRYATK